MSNLSFKAAWWLPGGHLQTLWPNFKKRKGALHIKRERLILPDEDFIDLDWLENKNVDNSGPIVILLHGLEGSIKSGYVKGMFIALKAAGFRVVLMNFRGCSGEHNKSPTAYHAGETNDFKFVVQTIHARYPAAKLAAIGFSLGGNVLLKYLGETQWNNPLTCATAISIPFLLNRFADRIQTGFSLIYQRQLLWLLCKKIQNKHQSIPCSIDISGIEKIKSFWQFDNDITAKLYGFKDAHDYYHQSSCANYLSNIKKPTLIIHAYNDPFVYSDAIPLKENLPTNVQLELSKGGGHMGFVAGAFPWRPRFWLEEKVPQYMKAFIA